MRGYKPAVLARGLLLLFDVHAAVGFGQQRFRIFSVFGIQGLSHAQRQNVFAAHFPGRPVAPVRAGSPPSWPRPPRQAGRHHDKFVATHAGHVVVLAAAVFQSLGKQAQHAIALQVAEAVVDLLEAVHVADHDHQRRRIALAPASSRSSCRNRDRALGRPVR